MYLLGASNGFLSEVIHTITGYEVEVCGENEELFPCPCCGIKTLTGRYNPREGTGYDFCPYCKWEDDRTTDIHSYRSINKGSILDYRNKISADPKKYETDIPEAELSKYNPDRMREGDRVCGFGGLCFCVICWFRLP